MPESRQERAERIASARRDGRLGPDARLVQQELDRRGSTLADSLADPHIRALADAATTVAEAQLPSQDKSADNIRKSPEADVDFSEDLELFYDEWDDGK